jgi:KDO2-lipid IV(A) lauroyltransferase
MVNPWRRRTAIDNIVASGIAAGPAARDLARESFRHFAVLVVETIRLREDLDSGKWTGFVDAEIPGDAVAVLRQSGVGAIVVSGHVGNWEVAARVLASYKPVVGIARGMNNPYADGVMKARKEGGRLKLTPKHGADAFRLIDALNGGNILALLVDQHAVRGGVPVVFFGRPASTYPSPAMLHLVTKAPLMFGYCVRTGHMKFRLVVSRPMNRPPSGNREEDVLAILRTLTAELESVVRKYPGQYLWGHRRWRLKA